VKRILLLTIVAALGLAGRLAAAESLQLTIHDGRVSLVARDVTVRDILAEWERVGRTDIVNGDRVPGGRVTLELTDVSEQEALDLLLGSIGGYVASERESAVPGASQYNRILILPAAAAAQASVARPTPLAPEPAPPPVVDQQPPDPQTVHLLGPDGLPIPDDQDGAPQAFAPLPPGFDGSAVETQSPQLQPGSAISTPQTGGATTPIGSPTPGMPVPAPATPQQPGQPAPR
jgi:hypothetical protein